MRFFLVTVTVLTATFDKWGIPVGLGDRTVSISPYKALLLISAAAIAMWASHSRHQFSRHVDPALWRTIMAVVLVQTLASLAGLALNSGRVSLPSEAYYLIQRSSVMLLPWLAFHAGMSRQALLSAFVAAVLLHDAFIALQYVSPAGYRAFADWVSDPYRADNGRLWEIDGDWFDFIGLQSTSNYGVLAASFGLLILGRKRRGSLSTIASWTVFAMTVGMAFISPSRSVVIMMSVALAVIAVKQRVAMRWQFHVAAVVFAFLAPSYVIVAGLPARNALYAFVDPERQGSNDGHVDVTLRSLALVQASPIVGYGARRFTELLNTTAIDFDEAVAETHSFYLSTLVQGGIVSMTAYALLMVAIVRRLWPRGADPTYAILCGLTIGLLAYNLTYDAGALDVFACFNGVVAYWALTPSVDTLSVPTPATAEPRMATIAPARLRQENVLVDRRLVQGLRGDKGSGASGGARRWVR